MRPYAVAAAAVFLGFAAVAGSDVAAIVLAAGACWLVLDDDQVDDVDELEVARQAAIDRDCRRAERLARREVARLSAALADVPRVPVSDEVARYVDALAIERAVTVGRRLSELDLDALRDRVLRDHVETPAELEQRLAAGPQLDAGVVVRLDDRRPA